MDVLMPQLGETVAEGKIVKWFKSAGDAVKPGDNLFEIETDKTSMEVPATSGGTLTEIRVPVGEVAKVGAVVAVIAGAGGAAMTSDSDCCPLAGERRQANCAVRRTQAAVADSAAAPSPAFPASGGADCRSRCASPQRRGAAARSCSTRSARCARPSATGARRSSRPARR